jgi:hypothetical protein
MRCWNCNEPVSPSAKACVRCEADLTKNTGTVDPMAVMEGLERLDDEAVADLRSVYEASETAEEFAGAILIAILPTKRSMSDRQSQEARRVSPRAERFSGAPAKNLNRSAWGCSSAPSFS